MPQSSRLAATSGCDSSAIFATQVRPEASFILYLRLLPPVSFRMKVTRRRFGRIAAPPGPKKRSREEMLTRSHITALPATGFDLLDCADTANVDPMASNNKTSSQRIGFELD